MARLNLAIVDLGAESGRVFLARYDGADLTLQEIHRFPNRPLHILGSLYWNLPSLWQEMLTGLRLAQKAAGTLHSVGIDTWAVDYGLLDPSGQLLGLPFHYRDKRTEGMMEQVFAHISRETLYKRTGIQFLPLNTLYQLVAHRQRQPQLFRAVERLLLIPDLLHYWLSGEQVSEYTNATTTQFWSVPSRNWAPEVLTRMKISAQILPPVIESGTVLGKLLPVLAQDFGPEVRVIAPATHDTASAIAAIPASETPGWAYVSSGTWSLVGMELSAPLLETGLADNFTNEGGVFSTVRYLRNVMGLWLLQECRHTWSAMGNEYDYEELMYLADQAPAAGPLLNPDESAFLAPGDMPERIQAYLVASGQGRAQTTGIMTRAILESLTMRYRQVLEMVSRASQTPLRTIHVVGGGAQNIRLNQWLADATGLPVIAGPVEASALGNALLQLVGLGELHSLADIRSLSRTVAQTALFTPAPEQRAYWEETYQRFLALPGGQVF